MLIQTAKGLYCAAGDFYIDPSARVERAVITHAHSDHARRGSQRYYCALPGLELLKVRLGRGIVAEGFRYGQPFNLGPIQISFHPAGHILGSAQVRLERDGEVWVASGDYKREPDPTCEPFTPVRCDVFITEATFGTPRYVWKKENDPGREIAKWWQENSQKGVNSVLFGYSLGKAQRLLALLKPHGKKQIYCDSSVMELNRCYEAQGISLAVHESLDNVPLSRRLEGELIIAPPSFLESPRAKILGEKFETAFASGWMSESGWSFRHQGVNRGFVISDHADWNDLVQTVQDTGARRVYVQHRGRGALVKHLRSLGIEAFPDTELSGAQDSQLRLI